MGDRHTDSEIRGAADAIFQDLLADLLLTNVISAHREIKRSRAVCSTCGTKCRTHLPLIQSSATSTSSTSNPNLLQPSQEAGPSRLASPQPRGLSSQSPATDKREGYTVGPEKGTGGATGIGSGSGRMDTNGNVFFDCLVCSRAVVSSKYAPHLSGCLGLNGSTRRGTSRLAATKARLNGNDRLSPSPYVNGSENGDSDVDSSTGKKKRPGSNGNGKRAKSPSKPTPAKKSKSSPVHQPSSAPNLLSQRPTLPPSRLGGPPMSISSPESSPSPQKSNGSSFGFGKGGTTGAKTVPGGSQSTLGGDAEGTFVGGNTTGQVADDSSDGDDDDY